MAKAVTATFRELPATFEATINALAESEDSRGALARRILNELLCVDGTRNGGVGYERDYAPDGDGFKVREVIRRLPRGSKATVQAGLAFIDGLRVQDAKQAFLAVQMFGMHTKALELLSTQSNESIELASRLLNTYGVHSDRLERMQLHRATQERKERNARTRALNAQARARKTRAF